MKSVVFEMKEKGLDEVANPSAVFLSERPENSPGSVVTASMEGTRPILVEIQSLATPSYLGTPRRTVLGIDHNRVAFAGGGHGENTGDAFDVT